MESATSLDRSCARSVTPRRRFLLLDAMILVAATAIGCGLIQWIGRETDAISWSELRDVFLNFIRSTPGEVWGGIVSRTFDLFLAVSYLSMPMVACWTLAVIPIRLLGPRSRFRRLARQPVMLAICAAGLPIAFMAVTVVVVSLVLHARGADERLDMMIMQMLLLMFVPMSLGSAVLAAWMGLVLGRRWRAEPSWVDRLGRCIGIYWITLGLAVPGFVLFNESLGSAGFRARTVSSGPTQVVSPAPNPSPSDAEAR